MKKTALSIIQNVGYRINQGTTSSLESQTNPSTLQWLYMLYEVCEELRQARTFTDSKRYYEFDTVSGTSKYKLPPDYYAPILGTYWNQDEDDVLYGPVGDAEFNARLYGELGSSVNYIYRIFGADTATTTEGGQLELYPTPSSAQTLSFNYITRNLFVPKYWVASTAYTTADYVFVNNNIYKCTSNGTSSAADPPSGTDASGIVDGTAQWGYSSAPYETVLANEDLCLFDYDLVQLGLEAKWLKRQGGDWQQREAEYRSKIDQALNRYRGSYVGSMCAQYSGPRYVHPYRSWSF